jgi:hypothetical protein
MLWISLVVVVSIVLLAVNGVHSYSFLSVGDWGGAFVGNEANVYAVAAEMNNTAIALGAQFIIGTGDNFYWCGIQNTSDPQINIDYVQPYSPQALQVPWYHTLGNHEYGYNVDAQVQFSLISNTWNMPSRYYTKRIQMSSQNYVTLIVLDTSPCVTDYRSTNQTNWDPCYPKYPTCSPTSTDDDFEGPCMFNQNIIEQDCNAQYNWFKNTLLGVPQNDWLVVIGHHPMEEITERDFISPMQQRGFSLYLNGHDHLLNKYTIDGSGSYFTTGAGSMVSTADQQHPRVLAKYDGREISHEELNHLNLTYHPSHNVVIQKTEVVAGFLSHTFSSDFSNLTTNMVKWDGSILYTYVSDKYGRQLN